MTPQDQRFREIMESFKKLGGGWCDTFECCIHAQGHKEFHEDFQSLLLFSLQASYKMGVEDCIERIGASLTARELNALLQLLNKPNL